MDAPPVQYVRTSDGFDIAYTVFGQGLPLVCVPFPFSHLQMYWTAPGDVRNWLECMAERFRLVYYDSRGQGMSTRGLGPEVTVDSFVTDLDVVINKLNLERVVLFGFGFAMGHAAIHFAARHPERIEALVLMTCAMNGESWPVAIFEDLAKENWDSFLWTIAPKGGSLEDIELSVRRLGASITQSDWLTTYHSFLAADVEPLLQRLTMPTLVLHPRDYRTLHSEESAKLAARIPEARFMLVEGTTRLGDPKQCAKTIEDFLRALPAFHIAGPGPLNAEALPDGLSQREVQVLRMIAAGRSNREIAEELVLSVRTVERHIANLYAKAGLHTKAQAASYAHQNNLI